MYPGYRRYGKREKAISLILSVITLLFLLAPFGAFAAESGGKVVRVGWYESSYNKTDELGRRSGYAYEYQQKIAAYTGWTYEYVEGSWPDLFQMLLDGRIDLLSDVSYTEERAKTLLYSSFPMGTEEYYLFVKHGNTEITTENLSSMNGKKAGVNKGSVQADMFREWAKANDITPEVVELTATHEDSLKMLRNGRIDIYISLANMVESPDAAPLCKIGASDFYFAVSGGNQELISELNTAMNKINNENPFYNQQLTVKYLITAGSNHFLEADELSWLQSHGTVRVGYQDNYLAFCAKDPETGELTGALKDYLRVAEDCLENAHIDFEAIAYPTAEAAMEAMKRGDVDCVFPANLTAFDGESQGLLITSKLMSTDMAAVVRQDEAAAFTKKERVTVAVNAGNPNYDMFLLDNFPEWRAIYYDTTKDGLKAIAEGNVDCLLISNYRFNNIAELCRKYKLTTISTGVALDYCFAVRREDTKLYSILGKITNVVPESTVNSALSFYFTEDAKLNVTDVLLQNLGLVIAVPALLIILLLFLLWRSARSEQKARETKKLISATEYDELTGLYDRNYFYEYADRMYRNDPDTKLDAIVLDIERFHSVNEMSGRDFGDGVLRELAEEIHSYLIGVFGIASRFEADNFALLCQGPVDFRALLDRLQSRLDAVNSNTSIRIRMGAVRWQENTEPVKLLDMARVACGLARNSNDMLVIYDNSVREREAYEQRIINDMRRALTDREFEVYYQPKYDIRCDPPELRSAEALVRWRHPELGMIPPGEFIPLLEKSGDISALDKYVWEQAASQIAEWKKKYGVTVPVSVNLSKLDLFDPTLESMLDGLIKDNGLDRRDLKLEVTESACTEDPYQIIDVIERLRQKGYEIEMDDFGSGYSSLNMLSSMPIDVLKMDRAFVSNIEHDEKDLQLVELILGIAQSLKIPVIAEGVETESQLWLLKEKGCALVQGFYFSRPLPANEFETKILDKELAKGGV